MISGQIGRTRIIQGWRWSKGARPGVRTYGERQVPSTGSQGASVSDTFFPAYLCPNSPNS
jgi:hypothetical protein